MFNPNQQAMPPGQNFNFNQMAPSWGGRYPWTPNFRFPQNPVTQTHAPHNTKATAEGIQQAMQKRSAQDNSAKRLSSSGEKSGVTFKHDNEGHATGQSAFATLDGYMKKAGLNSFQQQFFTRLIQQGLTETQIKKCVKQAGGEFGEKVAAELNSGFEKLAFAGVLPWLGRGAMAAGRYLAPKLTQVAAKRGVGAAAGLAAQQAKRGIVRGATNAAATAKDLASTQGLKNFGTGFMRQQVPTFGSKAMQAGQRVGNFMTGEGAKRQMLQGAASGAFNPYTGFTTWTDDQGNFDATKALSSVGGGALLSRFGGKPMQGVQRRALGGMGAGYGVGLGGNMMGFDVDTEALGRMGYVGGAALPNKLSGLMSRQTLKSLPKPLQKFIGNPMTNRAGTGTLDYLDPVGQGMRFAGKGIKNVAPGVGNYLKSMKPHEAAMLGGGLAAGAGGIAAPIMASRGVQSAANQMQENLMPLANYATETMGNINKFTNNPLGSMMGGVGNYLQENPMMAMALLGGLGAAGGGMMGGGTGATLGGVGLPLAYMLASGQNPLQGMLGGQGAGLGGAFGDTQAAAKGINSPLAQLPTRQQDNEISRQQQMQQQGNPSGDQAAAQMAAQASGQPDIQQLLAKATPQQMQSLQDPSVPEELKDNILQELSMH